MLTNPSFIKPYSNVSFEQISPNNMIHKGYFYPVFCRSSSDLFKVSRMSQSTLSNDFWKEPKKTHNAFGSPARPLLAFCLAKQVSVRLALLLIIKSGCELSQMSIIPLTWNHLHTDQEPDREYGVDLESQARHCFSCTGS